MPRTKQQKPRHITESEKANEGPPSPNLDTTYDNINEKNPKPTNMVECNAINSCNTIRDHDVKISERVTDSPHRTPAVSARQYLSNTENSEDFTPNKNPLYLNSKGLGEKETYFSDEQPLKETVASVQQLLAPASSPSDTQQHAATENKLLTLERHAEPANSPVELTKKTQRKDPFSEKYPQRDDQSSASNLCPNNVPPVYADAASKYMENLRLLMSQVPTSAMAKKSASDYARDIGVHNQYSSFTKTNQPTVDYYLSELTERWNQIMFQQLSKVSMANSAEGTSNSSITPTSSYLNQHHLKFLYPGKASSSPIPFANERPPADRQNYASPSNFNQFQPWPTHQIWLDYQASLAKLNPSIHNTMPPLNVTEADIKSKHDSRRSSLGSGYYSPNTGSPLSNANIRRQSQVKFDSDSLGRKPFDLPVSMYPSTSSFLSSPASMSGTKLQNLVSPTMQNILPLPSYTSLSPQSSNEYSRDPYYSTSGKIPPVKKSRSRGQPIDDIHAAIVREAKEQFKGLDPENMYIQCPICQKRIKRLYHFQRHMRIHTGEKTHHCKYCQYKSVRKDNLKSHMKTHDKQNLESNRRSVTSTSQQEREKTSRNSFNNKDEGPSYSYPAVSNNSAISRDARGSPLNMVNKFKPNFMPYPCFPTYNSFTQNFYCNQDVAANKDVRKSPREDSKIKEIQAIEPPLNLETETKRNGESVSLMSTTSRKSAGFCRSPVRQTANDSLDPAIQLSTKRDSGVLEHRTSDAKEKESSKKPKLSSDVPANKSFDKNEFSPKSNENINNNNKQSPNHIENNSLKQNRSDRNIDMFPQSRETSTTSFDLTYRISPVNNTADVDSPNSKLQHAFRYEKFQEFLSMRKIDTDSNSERSMTSSYSLTPDEFGKGSPRSQLSSTSSEDDLTIHDDTFSHWPNPQNNSATTEANAKPPYFQERFAKNDNRSPKNEEANLLVKKEQSYNANSVSSERSPESLSEDNLIDVTGVKEFSCRICKLTFNTNSDLQGHVSSNHKQDGFYKCSECIYLGKNLSKLVEHIRIHTGERPFKCNQCNYAAKRKDNLAQHKAVRHDKRKSKPVGLYSLYDHNTDDLQKNEGTKISREHSPAYTHKNPIGYSQFSKFPFDPNFSKHFLNRSDVELTVSPTAPLTPPFQMFNPSSIPARSPTMLHYPFFVPPIVHPMGMNTVLNGVASTNGSERIAGRYSFNIRAALI